MPTALLLASPHFFLTSVVPALISFSSNFLLFVLVDEVTKNENRLHDFLYDVFRFERQDRQDENEKQ